MKVLVTGGAGFIGSHLVDGLVDLGHQVIVLDDLSAGVYQNVNPAALFYEADVRDAERIAGIFAQERPEVVSHHAAQVDVTKSVDDPAADAETNVVGGINVLTGAVRSGVRRFIYASTAAVYGDPRYLPIDEAHPISPLSAYGLSKYTFEMYLGLTSAETGLNHVVLRYANVFGPRQVTHGEGGVVAVFAERLLSGETCRIFGDGTKTRDYVYVSDVVRANILAATTSCQGVLNLGTGTETTDKQVFETIRCAVGSSQLPVYEDVRPGEIRRSCFDSSRARDLLGWEPVISFADGVKSAVEYYRSKRRHEG